VWTKVSIGLEIVWRRTRVIVRRCRHAPCTLHSFTPAPYTTSTSVRHLRPTSRLLIPLPLLFFPRPRNATLDTAEPLRHRQATKQGTRRHRQRPIRQQSAGATTPLGTHGQLLREECEGRHQDQGSHAPLLAIRRRQHHPSHCAC
jgi:hypothetical protein